MLNFEKHSGGIGAFTIYALDPEQQNRIVATISKSYYYSETLNVRIPNSMGMGDEHYEFLHEEDAKNFLTKTWADRESLMFSTAAIGTGEYIHSPTYPPYFIQPLNDPPKTSDPLPEIPRITCNDNVKFDDFDSDGNGESCT